MSAAQVFEILKWINGFDFDEFIKAIGVDLAEVQQTPHRYDYWIGKFERIRKNLFEGLCRELDQEHLDKLWAYALERDRAYKSKKS